MRNISQQNGFTLVELMIAMVISLTLIFACSSVYSSLQASIQTAKAISTAQESLRSAHYLMSRSVRQGYEMQVNVVDGKQQLQITYGDEADTGTFYGCLGEAQAAGSSELFFVDDGHLYCRTSTLSAERIALDVTELKATLATSPLKGVQVTLAIDGMPGDMADDGFSFWLAMRQRILIDAGEEGASNTALITSTALSTTGGG